MAFCTNCRQDLKVGAACCSARQSELIASSARATSPRRSSATCFRELPSRRTDILAMPMSERNSSAANCNAPLNCCSATSTTSRSARKANGKCCNARPCSRTMARASKRSHFKSSDTWWKARQSCWTAATATSKVPRSSGEAYSSNWPSNCTAAVTMSISLWISNGALASWKGSFLISSSQATCSKLRRTSVNGTGSGGSSSSASVVGSGQTIEFAQPSQTSQA
mmetsp:Transcript_69890/g.167766  ORF Transcript_69890/g.167766 Transcript_69890/m.167766 type:complete len:224 (+) Transcript_69890:449-1120(+)